MIDGLKPYLRMKESGVPELGAVPEHWTVEPIARIGRLFKANGANKEDEVSTGIPCVRYGDLYTRHEFFVTSTKACVAPDRASLYTTIRHGDVLFAASGETMEDIGRSAVNLLNVDARCGGDVIVLRPAIDIDSRFLGYASDAPPSRHQKASMGRGFTVVHVYTGELKRLALPLPPIGEQRAIARFLDHAARRIRRYIRAKQKLVCLLEEQQQAIIHRAVTRGLDPRVGLRPSLADDLGDVPAHWEVLRLSQVIAHGPQNGVSPAPDERGEAESFSIAAIRGGRVDVRETDKKRVAVKPSISNTYCLRKGDVLLVRGNGNVKFVGQAGVVSYDMPGFVYPDLLMRIRTTSRCHPEFLVRLINGPIGRRQIEARAKTAVGTFKINNQHVRQLTFALPPIEEQAAILQELNRELESSSLALDRISREITLLGEFRSRLLADVISGKRDVRELAMRIPSRDDDPDDDIVDEADDGLPTKDVAGELEPAEA